MKNLLILLTFLVGVAHADSLPVLEVPHAILKPRVDATPLDTAWSVASNFLDFTLSKNTADLKALPTQVRALWDEGFLYFRFRVSNPQILTPFAGNERDQKTRFSTRISC